MGIGVTTTCTLFRCDIFAEHWNTGKLQTGHAPSEENEHGPSTHKSLTIQSLISLSRAGSLCFTPRYRLSSIPRDCDQALSEQSQVTEVHLTVWLYPRGCRRKHSALEMLLPPASKIYCKCKVDEVPQR